MQGSGNVRSGSRRKKDRLTRTRCSRRRSSRPTGKTATLSKATQTQVRALLLQLTEDLTDLLDVIAEALSGRETPENWEDLFPIEGPAAGEDTAATAAADIAGLEAKEAEKAVALEELPATPKRRGRGDTDTDTE